MERIIGLTSIGIFCVLSVLALGVGCSLGATGSKALEAFPQAKDGEIRHVIYLGDKLRGEEENFKVELIPGKVAKTDGVNVARVGLFLDPVTLKGWGYTYYHVSGKDLVMSTMMAVPEGVAPVERFVAGKSLMVRYNSRLPIVIYSPEGVDVRYRLWTGGELLEVPTKE